MVKVTEPVGVPLVPLTVAVNWTLWPANDVGVVPDTTAVEDGVTPTALDVATKPTEISEATKATPKPIRPR